MVWCVVVCCGVLWCVVVCCGVLWCVVGWGVCVCVFFVVFFSYFSQFSSLSFLLSSFLPSLSSSSSKKKGTFYYRNILREEFNFITVLN